jgi:uncharacterized protein (UPF0335 family)
MKIRRLNEEKSNPVEDFKMVDKELSAKYDVWKSTIFTIIQSNKTDFKNSYLELGDILDSIYDMIGKMVDCRVSISNEIEKLNNLYQKKEIDLEYYENLEEDFIELDKKRRNLKKFEFNNQIKS